MSRDLVSKSLVWIYRVLPALALALLVVLLFWIVRQTPADASQQPAGSPAPQGQSAAAIAAADRYKDEVKLYLEWIIAIAGIFSLAQTVAAGFAAQSFSDQAEKTVNQIDEMKNSTASEFGALTKRTGEDLERFKARYQSVVLAEEARIVALDELRKSYRTVAARGDGDTGGGQASATPVGWLDWRLDLFGAMDVIKRQRLLSIDRYLGFDLQLETIPGKVDRQNILRLLANFYVAKFDYEKVRGTPNWMDLERAEYLLRLGIRHLDAPFWFHNDLGLVLVKYADRYGELKKMEQSRRSRGLAKQAYEEACRMEPRQQRCYYNLARIVRDLGQRSAEEGPSIESLKEAIRLSEKAIPIPIWEIAPNKSMQGDIVYNLACYMALLAYAEVKDRPGVLIAAKTADDVLKVVEQLTVEGTIRKNIVDNDFAEDGDFAGFESRLPEPQKQALAQLRVRLSLNQPPDEVV